MTPACSPHRDAESGTRKAHLPTAAAVAALAVTALLCWLPWAGLFADAPPPNGLSTQTLWMDVAWLRDPEGAIKPSRIAGEKDMFRPLPPPMIRPGPPPGELDHPGGAVWFLLRPLGTPPPEGTIVEMGNPHPRGYTVVLPGAGGIPVVQHYSGRFVRFQLPETSAGEFFVRVEGGQGPLRPPRLMPALAHGSEQGKKGLALGMFYGGLLILAAINILLGLLLGESGHAWYAASLGFLGGAFFLGFDDVAGAALTGPVDMTVPVRCLGAAWLFCGLGLTRSFLHTARRTPRLDKALRAAMLLLCAALPVLLLLPGRQLGPAFALLVLLVALLALAAGHVSLRQGFRPAGLFLAAWLLVLVFPLMPFIWRTIKVGGLPPPGHTLSLIILLQAALFTASLLGKVRSAIADGILQRERRRAESRIMDEQRRLFSEVSHELAGPLSRLGLAIELCGRGEADEILAEGMARDHAALAALRAQMLDLARIEAAALKGRAGTTDRQEHPPVDLTRIALAAAAEANRGAGLGAVRVESDSPPPFSGDAVLLARAVDNLVRNALLHAGAPVCIDIRTAKEAASVSLAVRDQGRGVAEADLERIFAPFERAAGPSGPGGSGLGLSIVRRVAELHGGTARARNLPGTGFEVRLELPIPGAGGAPSTDAS